LSNKWSCRADKSTTTFYRARHSRVSPELCGIYHIPTDLAWDWCRFFKNTDGTSPGDTTTDCPGGGGIVISGRGLTIFRAVTVPHVFPAIAVGHQVETCASFGILLDFDTDLSFFGEENVIGFKEETGFRGDPGIVTSTRGTSREEALSDDL
jgi:hypothetical protein